MSKIARIIMIHHLSFSEFEGQVSLVSKTLVIQSLKQAAEISITLHLKKLHKHYLYYCKPGNFLGSFIFAIFAVTLEARK